MKPKRLLSFVANGLFVALLIQALPAQASTLYTLNVTGELLSVDQETGATSQLAAGLGVGSWSGLAASPIDANVLFTINNPRPPTLDDTQFSRLARIDLDTGQLTLFPLFDGDALGRPDIFSSGIAISPNEPDVAIVSGSDVEFPPQPFLYRVDTVTGQVLEPAKPLANVRRIESLTFGLDGTTLYGTNQDGALVTIDPQTAAATIVGDPGLTDFLTGLAFHPDDGSLFAINGLRRDHLVTLDASSGALVKDVGALGITGPEGLAFVADLTNELDCTGDGLVDVADLACSNAHDTTSQLLVELNLLPGDLNGQNGVDFEDFLTLSANFGQPLGRYIDGDINNDGQVGFPDFLEISVNFGKTATASAATVPEPSSQTMFGLLFVLSLVSMRKRENGGKMEKVSGKGVRNRFYVSWGEKSIKGS